jgi:hypothetical protein
MSEGRWVEARGAAWGHEPPCCHHEHLFFGTSNPHEHHSPWKEEHQPYKGRGISQHWVEGAPARPMAKSGHVADCGMGGD